MAKLSVQICGLNFLNPILPAAGPPSKDGAMLQAAANGGAGGLVTKTISVIRPMCRALAWRRSGADF
jgi:dihydroorotate dehydrogenase (NAD+) catalytic subunit